MTVVYALFSVAALLALSPAAVVLGSSSPGRAAATNVVYGACLIVTLTLLTIALLSLFAQPAVSLVTLPLGLPWLGAHFRIDALSAFFLIVVNLGGAAASLFALGYGRHEEAPQRVLPFFPAYLAAMNLVVLADDAFSFLVSWEFMSLTSWALVISNHRLRENMRAGYVYLLMAGFGTLTLLLGFGLLAGADGNYAFDAIRANAPVGWDRGACADPRACRRRLESRPGAVACLAAAGASGRAQPRLGADERRDDQGRGLRFHPHRLRPARPAAMVVEPAGAQPWRRHRGHGRALCIDAARPQARAGLFDHREYRFDLRLARPGAGVQGLRHERSPPRSRSPPRCCMCSIIRCSRACCFSAPAPCSTPPAPATWNNSAA